MARARKPPAPNDPVTGYAVEVLEGRAPAGPYVRDACARHIRDIEHGSKRGIRFDLDVAKRAISFCPDVLRLNGGKHEGAPFRLLPWQAFIVGSVYGWQNSEGFRRFRMAYIEGGKGPLALNTPIATPVGWTTMGALAVGDKVFAEDGQPCHVIDASQVFTQRDCFRIEWSDGTSVVADAEHRWPVHSLRSGGLVEQRKGGQANLTTAQIAATFRMPVSNSIHPQARWNHRSAATPPLALPDQILPIPPYTLGAWLGDGDSDCARVTCAFADMETIEHIKADGVPVNAQIRHSDTTGRFSLSTGIRGQLGTVNERLRALGLLGYKHIPAIYLRGSDAQRMALLQGLMDTSGFVEQGGGCELTLCNERLSLDAQELIRSLGFKVNAYRASPATLNGRVVGERFCMSFHAYQDRPPFRMARKVARLSRRPLSRALSAGRMIVDVRPVRSGPVRCITIDHPSHVFLAGDGMVPTCNSGKSPLAAAIGLIGLVADKEPRAEVYAAASKKDQAQILFRDAVAMVRQSPALSQRITFSGGPGKEWNMAHLASGSFFRTIASDTGQSGPRPHVALLDEVHEHPDATMVEMLRAGTKGRRQALIFMITNSGHSRTSVCWNYHEYAAKVCSGALEDDAFFAYVCALDDGDDPLNDESCWPKANPSLGHTITARYLREQVTQARGMPSKEGIVLRLNFCRWTDAESTWIDFDLWNAVEADFVIDDLRGLPCSLGLDLSSKKDLTALAAAWTHPDGRLSLAVWFWTPGDTLDNRARVDGVPYAQWRDEGFVFAPAGRTVDKRAVATFVQTLAAEHQVEGLYFDQALIEDFQRACDDVGLDTWIDDGEKSQRVGIRMVRHGQGFAGYASETSLWMPRSISDTEDAIIAGPAAIEIQRNPCLRWNAASAVLVQDPSGNRKWDKRKATGRIDGMVAAAMAVGGAKSRPAEQRGGSIWDSPELLATLGLVPAK